MLLFMMYLIRSSPVVVEDKEKVFRKFVSSPEVLHSGNIKLSHTFPVVYISYCENQKHFQ